MKILTAPFRLLWWILKLPFRVLWLLVSNPVKTLVVLAIVVTFSSLLRGRSHDALETPTGFFSYAWWMISDLAADTWRALMYFFGSIGEAWTHAWGDDTGYGILVTIGLILVPILVATRGMTLGVKVLTVVVIIASAPFLVYGLHAFLTSILYWCQHTDLFMEMMIGVALIALWVMAGGSPSLAAPGGGGGKGGH